MLFVTLAVGNVKVPDTDKLFNDVVPVTLKLFLITLLPSLSIYVTSIEVPPLLPNFDKP
jgi:hypothetical protein